MKFLIFVKQVPVSSEIRFDSDKKTIIREGVKNEMNAYDRRAITEAIRYRNENGGEVVVVTMGPSQARDALKEALIMGADSCIHIQDPHLAGSDTLITARVLSAAAKKIGYDIIFCGQHSTDSETGQVPVELAEILGLPCATAVRKIEYLPNRSIQVACETEEGSLILEMSLPAVVTSAERLIRPLKTKNADLTSVPDEKISQIDLKDLEVSSDSVGSDASPTWVADIQTVSVARSTQIWDGADVPATALRIVDLLRSHKNRNPASQNVPDRSENRQMDRSYWCWIELLRGQVRPVSLEILSAAAALASENGGSVCAILADPVTTALSQLLSSYGADKIIHIPGETLHPDPVVTLLVERIGSEQPFALFFPATSFGKYLAPRIAARLNLGLTGDCVGLQFTNDGKLAQMKPAFGGNVIAPIFTRTTPVLATIRPGALESRNPREADEDLEVVQWMVPQNVSERFTIIAREIDPGVEATRLDHAKLVVGIGAGLGQENMRTAHRLAELLHGAVGATRKVIDQGWIERQFQIGLTGKLIAPDVYLGLGISGRYNHMIGIRKAGLLIAINQEASAEVFQSVDIGIHGDCVAIAEELVRILENSKE
jgi:electron transfer flavoprotein alpha subunit